jgi:hypothetical protein
VYSISCLDCSLGRVPGAGDPGSIPGGGKLNVCLLKDRDDPGQVSLYCSNHKTVLRIQIRMDPH